MDCTQRNSMELSTKTGILQIQILPESCSHIFSGCLDHTAIFQNSLRSDAKTIRRTKYKNVHSTKDDIFIWDNDFGPEINLRLTNSKLTRKEDKTVVLIREGGDVVLIFRSTTLGTFV